MGQDEESQRLRGILTAHDLSDEEYELLSNLRAERAPPDKFVIYGRDLDELGRAPEVALPEYVAALDRLIARGLVFILTVADIDKERQRRAVADLPELSRGFPGARPGFVEHTPAGAALLRQVLTELGGDHLALHDAGGDHDYRNHRWDFYASRAEVCASLLASTARGNEVVETYGPVEIGPWRPDQFAVLPRGFHCYFRYLPRDRRSSPK
jgi:hypothetical protein